MAIDQARRALLGRGFALLGAGALPFHPATANGGARRDTAARGGLPPAGAWPALLASWARHGSWYAGAWTVGAPLAGAALPSRAHGLIVDPCDRRCAVATARRPGDWLARFALAGGGSAVVVDTDPDRVFNGHAAFSNDGRTLYTSENDVDDGAGVVGLRDPRTLAKRGELPTHGIGPHELLVEPAGTLLVANGGILTVPEMGRAKLDVERMDPSLVRIDARDGRLLGQWRLPDSRLGIRHLARAPDGRVGIALQAEHAAREERIAAPLLAIFDGATLRCAALPPGVALGGYGGDIACVAARDSARFAVSCTRAGSVAWWGADGTWQGSTPLPEACALAACGASLVALGEAGAIVRIGRDGDEVRAAAPDGFQWDNHAVVVAAAA